MSTAAPKSSGPSGRAGEPRGDLPLEVVNRSGTVGDAPAPWRIRLRDMRPALLIPIVMALMMLGGLIGIYFQPPGLRFVMKTLGIEAGGGTSNPIAVPARPGETKAARQAGTTQRSPATVVGLGRILPGSYIITVAPPFGAADARVAAFRVKEGERVERGDVLAVLDSEATLKAAADAAEAVVLAREAAVRQTREATNANRAEAQASLARAEATLANARREFDRTMELRQKGFAAEQTLDQKRAAYVQAEQDVERARATLSRYNTGDLAAQADVEVALRNLATAKADHQKAMADLEKAYARAPITGTVLTIHARAGEKPGAQGIMSLGNLETMMAELEVYQTQVGAVTAGAPVTLTADALPGPLHGRVSRIGLEVERQSLTDASPAANTDARIVKVYVALDDAATEIARRFSNLQVTARITVADRPGERQ